MLATHYAHQLGITLKHSDDTLTELPISLLEEKFT
jgi:hypothetical protein